MLPKNRTSTLPLSSIQISNKLLTNLVVINDEIDLIYKRTTTIEKQNMLLCKIDMFCLTKLGNVVWKDKEINIKVYIIYQIKLLDY